MSPASSDPRLLVFGASGYTGRALVVAAREAGHDVVAHLRPDSPSGETMRPQWERAGVRVETCPWEPEAIDALVSSVQPTCVYALLGTTRKKAKAAGQGADYASVDKDMTLMALRATARLAAEHRDERRRFVYLSALGVRPGASNPYLRVRAEVEAELRERASEVGFDFVIARPAFITGSDRKESRPAERAAAILSDGPLKLLGALGLTGVRDRFMSIDAAALASGLLRAASDPEAANAEVDSAWLRA